MRIIEAKNLIKDYYAVDKPVRVINGISLFIEEGEFVAITGESGSGKSTLLYLLSGLEPPTNGEIKLMGLEITKFSEKELTQLRLKHLSFVYQYYNLIPNLTIYENIILPIRLKGKIKEEDRAYIEELINIAGISNIKDRLPEQVSGGEQQRTAIVRAVGVKSSIVFADEPCGNLDSNNSDKVMNLLKDINQRYNTTIVLVTHSNSQAEVARRRIILKDGRIL